MTFSSLAEKQERKEGDVKSPVNRGSQKDIPAASQSKVDVWKERWLLKHIYYTDYIDM